MAGSSSRDTHTDEGACRLILGVAPWFSKLWKTLTG